MMRFFSYLLLTFTPYFLYSQAGKVKVHVTYTNSYCGGARPTPEIEQKTKTPRTLHDVHLILTGKKHCKTATDSAGYFSLPLKPGKYKVQLSYHKNDAHETNYNPSCKKMLNMSFGELIITQGVYEYELNLHFPCDPCSPPRP